LETQARMHISNEAHGLGCDVRSFNLLAKVKTFPKGFYPN